MIREAFTEYCINNKTVCIVPNEFEGFKIFFENGEYIEAVGGIDGIEYTHVSEEIKTDTKRLLKEFNEQMPEFYEKMTEKYGNLFPPIEKQ